MNPRMVSVGGEVMEEGKRDTGTCGMWMQRRKRDGGGIGSDCGGSGDYTSGR